MQSRKFIMCSATIIVAVVIAFSLHVFVGNAVEEMISKAISNVRMASPPYSTKITIIAGASALIPGIISFIIFFIMYPHIPLKSPISKGILFGLAILCIKGSLIRMLLMNTLVGMPVHLANFKTI